MLFFFRKCGELQGGQTLEYETTNNGEYNLMMFKFDSQFVSSKEPTRGFFVIFEAFNAGWNIYIMLLSPETTGLNGIKLRLNNFFEIEFKIVM